MIDRIVYRTRVPAWLQGQLESLLYFNGGQHRVRAGIAASIERYGVPELTDDGDGWSVRVGDHAVETLWAVQEAGALARVVGVLVYLRDVSDEITVVHVGVADDYAQGGPNASEHVLTRLLHEARRIARDTDGVQHFAVAYRQTRMRLAHALTA